LDCEFKNIIWACDFIDVLKFSLKIIHYKVLR
jgi:hypothetical protein